MISLSFLQATAWVLLGAAILGAVYQFLGIFAVRRLRTLPPPELHSQPPVTLLKPLCGDEPSLYINLRSFCELDYPEYQIVFGVRDPNDPGVAVVERLRADLPGADIALVASPAVYGANFKVSNLMNMVGAAKYDTLVLSDSDMRARPGYLDILVGSLRRPGIGLATSLYVGQPTRGLWSELGAAGINFWFLPSALISKLFGGTSGCYGATIALRRDTLDRIGGFAALKDQLADDYALGHLVRGAGLEIAVAPYMLDTTVHEPSFRALFRHELRWARTIRNTAPIGFAGSIVTHTLPLALLGGAVGLVAGVSPQVLDSVLALAAVGRFALVVCVSRALAAPRLRWWLLLPRDVLSVATLILAYFGRSVSWRNSAFRVDASGALSTETDGISA